MCCSCTVRQCVAACCNVLGQSIRHYRMYCGNQYFLGAVQVWTRCKSGPDESHESCHMCMSHESCHMCRRKSGPDESLPGFKSTDGVHGNIDCELHEFRITNNHKYRVYRDSILIYYNHQWFTTTIEEFPPLGPCSLLQSSPLQSVAV